MAIPSSSTVAIKLPVLLLIVVLTYFHAGVLPSRASRVVVTVSPQSENVDDDDDYAPTIRVRNEERSPPKRGKGVVMITSSSGNRTSSSWVQSHYDDTCNDTNCAYYYLDMCQPEDQGRCSVGCYCNDNLCHCICSS